jgi:immune inhibitor A
MLEISEFNRLRITLLKPLNVVGIIALLAVVIGCSTPVIDGSPTEEATATSQSATAVSLPTEASEVATVTPEISPSPTTGIQTPEPISTPKPVDQSQPTQISPTATSATAPTATEQPTPTRTPYPTRVPTATPEFIPAQPEPIIPAPPDRDLQELGKRLVPGYTDSKTVVASEPLLVGDNLNFWVSRDAGSVTVNGTVSHISEHAYWVFETGYEPDPSDIEEVASNFESDVWPAVTQVFGTPLTPGIDGDDRMVVYTAVLASGVAGYFSAADSYPKEIRSHSNQREALYMSADRLNLSGTEYLSVIAHELQHAIHFATDNSEDSWVNEGLSEVAAEIAGFARSAASAFVRAPATSLTAWAQDISVPAANYGAANLFFAFLSAHYGGNEMLAAIAQHQADGIESVDLTLAERGFDATADDVYADWLVANYLSASEGPYAYEDHFVPPVRNVYKRAPDSLSGSVKSYGANYVVTSSGSGRMTVEFKGEATTSLLSEAPHSGDTCWWSNQGDSIDSTLTRNVDLRSVNSASLTFWVSYHIEEFWDYAYVVVSNDDGSTWDILDTERAINFNPNGNGYGAGLTGTSLGWVQDSVDLSEYAGEQVLLRFEYITDDAVFSQGACFDDFEIPELGWTDNTSTSADWNANGFVRIEETIPTQYLVQVVHEKDVGDPVVYQVAVNSNGAGILTVENVGDDDLVVVIVSATNRQSTLPTNYSLDIRP